MYPGISRDYYVRKCFLRKNEVPKLSEIKKKMGDPLAKVFFKSMNPRLRAMAGLEPELDGAGPNLWIPPHDNFTGDIKVRPPFNKAAFKYLNNYGITLLSEQLEKQQQMKYLQYNDKVLRESDLTWRTIIEKTIEEGVKKGVLNEHQRFEETANRMLYEFEILYRITFNELEDTLKGETVEIIVKNKEETIKCMNKRYDDLLKNQNSCLECFYCRKTKEKKEILKWAFIKSINEERESLKRRLTEIYYEKYGALQLLKQQYDCMNKAARLYVLSAEKQRATTEKTEIRKKYLSDLAEIQLNISEKEKGIEELLKKKEETRKFNEMWEKKVCKIVETFQKFITFCLRNLPEQADFFINMEKLMMLQMNQAINNPESRESIITDGEEEDDNCDCTQYYDVMPTLAPSTDKPFIVVGDFKRKPVPDPRFYEDLPDDVDLPIVIINKKYIYAKCDNHENFIEKLKSIYIDNKEDDVEKEQIKHCSSDLDISHIKTFGTHTNENLRESSLMKILDSETSLAKIISPECNCSVEESSLSGKSEIKLFSMEKCDTCLECRCGCRCTVNRDTKNISTDAPCKRQSVSELVEKYACPYSKCMYKAKGVLEDHLPPYMTAKPLYGENLHAPLTKSYEACSKKDLESIKGKVMKKKAMELTEPEITAAPSTGQRDVATQYEDLTVVKDMCFCFEPEKAAEASEVIDKNLIAEFEALLSNVSKDHLEDDLSNFATKRLKAIQDMLNLHPSLLACFRIDI